jgi:TAT (twin-arginine translocation) pathway signal sequence
MSKHITRRRFLQYGAAGGAALFLPWARTPGARAAAGGSLTKYLEPVPTDALV